MTTILISILSGVLGLTIGYALGRINGASCALQFGEWNILGWKGNCDPNTFYFCADADKTNISLYLNKNGDFDLTIDDTKNAK